MQQLDFRSDTLARKYADAYGVSEASAKHSLGSAVSVRLLNLLASEAGLLDTAVKESLLELETKRVELDARERWVKLQKSEIESLVRKNEAVAEEANHKLAEMECARESLESLDSPELKDQYRFRRQLLKTFLDTVDVRTDQNNTYFIAACGAILAGCPVEIETKKSKGNGAKSAGDGEEPKPKRTGRRSNCESSMF